MASITRSEFRNHADALPVVINGAPHTAVVKEFSTGSLGWNINGKLTLPVNGKAAECQVGLNLTLIGSKELPK